MCPRMNQDYNATGTRELKTVDLKQVQFTLLLLSVSTDVCLGIECFYDADAIM
jgi:hypothetical protein